MRPSYAKRGGFSSLRLAVLAGCVLAGVLARAQDLTPGLTYVCNGERVFIENCNVRDTSDTAKCMVGHPDHVNPNGLMQYTYESRGDLKKLFPTCKPPSDKQVAAAHAFQKKQDDQYNANEQKATQQLNAQQAAGANMAQPAKPRTPEERATNRCITAGRLPSSCVGNSLLGAFGQMLSAVLPATGASEPSAGPVMAGVFQGAGNWRLDFVDGGVLVNCAFLSPNQESYKIDFRESHTVLEIATKPKPLILTVRPDGTITGPGPVVIDGVVSTGTSGPDPTAYSQYHDSNGGLLTNGRLASGAAAYDGAGNRVYPTGAAGGTPTFAARRATCPALNLSSKGAGVGIQTMQTDLLKGMFGGDKGPPTPPGIRMHGIFAAQTGFSAQFFPESVVLGCGPDAARAYPYTVVAEGGRAVVKVDAPDHPLAMAYRDGSLDAGTGAYQVHGRVVTGQNDNDDFTFAPMERTCDLAVLAPSNHIPEAGGTAAPAGGAIAGAGGSGSAPSGAGNASGGTAGGGLSTPQAPLGNATLSIVSGLVVPPGTPNPLAGRPYLILRDSYANTVARAGVQVPAGVSAYKYVGQICANQTPDCKKASDAIKAAAASAVRGDANGSGTLPGVPPGRYYLMISARVNNQPVVWGQAVDLRAGTNSVTLEQRNATPVN